MTLKSIKVGFPDPNVMACIRFLESEEMEFLRGHHTFGRRMDAVDTYLSHEFVSKIHAAVEWIEPNWLIRDLSHNGTWVNGYRLSHDSRIPLEIGDHVDLGSEELRIEIIDLSPPENLIFPAGQPERWQSLEDGVLIPNEDQPEFGFYVCPERRQWFCESLHPGAPGEETGPLGHGDHVQCNQEIWQIYLTNSEAPTAELSRSRVDISSVEFRFDLSQDEESTHLRLVEPRGETDLGERSHHYLMVHLLRHRRSQMSARPGDNPSSLGWMNSQVLMRELGVEEVHLNMLIFRARKQITAATSQFQNNSQVIERRRGSIRATIENFSIYKEGVRED